MPRARSGRSILIAAVLAATFVASTVTPMVAGALEGATVSVDATADLGPATFAASGFLHADAADGDRAQALKPQSWRMGGFLGEQTNYYNRARQHGAKVMLVVHDDWVDATGNYQPWLDWPGYEAFVRWTVKRHLREFPVEWWDIMNEPEVFGPSGGNRENFLNVYLHSYKAIHEGYAEFVAEQGGVTDIPPPKIVAPSTSAFQREPVNLDAFLDFAAANDMRLEGIAWHELCSSSVETCPVNPHDVTRHIDQARAKMASRGPVFANTKIMINEYPSPTMEDVPGTLAGYIAALEHSNAVQASHACWPEPGGGDNCHNDMLNGLVDRDGTTPRDSYWVYKAYADMVGTKVATAVPTMATTPATVTSKPFSAYATHDAANREVRVLLGRHEARCSSAPNFWCTPVPSSALPPPLAVTVDVKVPWKSKTVTVRRQVLARPEKNYAPNTTGFTFVDRFDLPVVGGVAKVPIEAFGDGAAWSLVLDEPRSRDPLPALSAPVPALPPSSCPTRSCTPTEPSGTWQPTGSLYWGVNRARAVTLDDGSVLLGGGFAHNAATDVSRLYDPATGTWTAQGRMATRRILPTLTALDDGRVLVAGGEVYASLPALTELFSRTTGRWSASGNMVVPRYDHTATKLRDGRVLVAGGWTQYLSTAPTSTAEMYDPATGVWTGVAPMVMPRAGATASLLPDGRVLLAGGLTGQGVPVPTTEIWDPSTGLWSVGAPLLTPRGNHTATILADGRVLVVGGSATPFQSEGNSTEAAATDSAEVFDPRVGTWAPAGAAPGGPRTRHTATKLLDGRDIIAGGVGADGAFLASSALYEPTALPSGTGVWSTGADLAGPRAFHTASALLDGSVLVAGGDEGPAGAAELTSLGRYNFMKVLSSAEVYVASGVVPEDPPPTVPEIPMPGLALAAMVIAGACAVAMRPGRRRRRNPETGPSFLDP